MGEGEGKAPFAEGVSGEKARSSAGVMRSRGLWGGGSGEGVCERIREVQNGERPRFFRWSLLGGGFVGKNRLKKTSTGGGFKRVKGTGGKWDSDKVKEEVSSAALGRDSWKACKGEKRRGINEGGGRETKGTQH